MTQPFCLTADKAMFLMIDVQEKLLPAMSDGALVLKESKRLLRVAKTMNIPVLATEQYPNGLGQTAESLRSFLESGNVLPKTTFSCFGADGFAELLERQQRPQVIVFGVESHICVFSTVTELLRRGYQTVVACEACSSRNPAHHEIAMRNLMAAGAPILPVETIAYQLLYRSGTPEFKSLLPLFK